ncbi:radical SAM/SPASM domain-containing protein [Erythrobacter sp. JK5]|uniref:radical SAM/SPASM domain-containing protein n=1 Tax=Erythrobacter sp. JK5 TaxID=2829500 RepID=UPI001BA4F4E7|nr:radical SAM protein [Erythrobacter sp. JK5]QUL38772.1 SPASM domain-containing protein [Erythrobacter sp. JK5]
MSEVETLDALRLRDTRLISREPDGPLLYDLERTYLFEVPDEMSDRLGQWPPARSDPALERWLADNDLLTRLPVPAKREAKDAPPPQVTDVSIDLPGACNMGCTYCFEKPSNSRIGPMSDATLAQTVDFAFAAAKGAPKVVFHFGSGEPVIQFEQLKALTAMALDRAAQGGQEVEFELTTNATLVTAEIARFFAAHPYNIRVSCDGPAAIHDRFRPMANGRGSYPLVERGLKLLLEELPERVTVNSVFCSGTRLSELWDWAQSLGIRHYHAIKVGADEESDEHLRSRDLADFIEDSAAIADEIFTTLKNGGRPIDYHPLAKTVRRMMLPQPITRFCGVAGSYVGVRADGAIYPCFRHLGLEEYRLGHVSEGLDDERRQAFRHAEAAEVDNRPHCRDCWARYICGGGCYADSVVYEQDRLAPQTAHCPYWRAEIEEGIRLYHRLRSEDPLLCLAMFEDDVDRVLDEADARIMRQVRTF